MPLISAKEVNCTSDSSSGAREDGGDGAAPASAASGESLPAEVEEERRHNVEAAIVRIMKARKTLSHNELVMETTRQLSTRFTPNPQVRQCICQYLCVWTLFLCFVWKMFIRWLAIAMVLRQFTVIVL